MSDFSFFVEVLFSTLTNPSRNLTAQMLNAETKNATGTSRHQVTHHILRAHPALLVVAEVRLERNSGRKLFELQIQMIESNNTAYTKHECNHLPTLASLSQGERGDGAGDIRTLSGGISHRPEHVASVIPVNILLPAVPLLSGFRCYRSGEA